MICGNIHRFIYHNLMIRKDERVILTLAPSCYVPKLTYHCYKTPEANRLVTITRKSN